MGFEILEGIEKIGGYFFTFQVNFKWIKFQNYG